MRNFIWISYHSNVGAPSIYMYNHYIYFDTSIQIQSKVFIAPPSNVDLNLGSLKNLSQSRRWKWFGWKISLEDYINHPKKGGGRCRKMVFWKPTEFPHVQTSASAGLSGNRTLHLLNVWMFGSKNQVISWRTKIKFTLAFFWSLPTHLQLLPFHDFC